MNDYEAKSAGVLTVVMPVYNEENSIVETMKGTFTGTKVTV